MYSTTLKRTYVSSQHDHTQAPWHHTDGADPPCRDDVNSRLAKEPTVPRLICEMEREAMHKFVEAPQELHAYILARQQSPQASFHMDHLRLSSRVKKTC